MRNGVSYGCPKDDGSRPKVTRGHVPEKAFIGLAAWHSRRFTPREKGSPYSILGLEFSQCAPHGVEIFFHLRHIQGRRHMRWAVKRKGGSRPDCFDGISSAVYICDLEKGVRAGSIFLARSQISSAE